MASALLQLLELQEKLLEPLQDVTLSKKIEAMQRQLRSNTEKLVPVTKKTPTGNLQDECEMANSHLDIPRKKMDKKELALQEFIANAKDLSVKEQRSHGHY
eukprot:2265779-Rhodomonas_salina.1